MSQPAHWREPLDQGDGDLFTFVLPAGWARIRLRDARERDRDVRRLVRTLAHARTDRDRLLPGLTATAQRAVHGAADPQAIEAHLSTTLGGGPPLACALTVSLLPVVTAGPGELCAALLATARDGDVAALVRHEAGPAARLQRGLAADPRAGRDHPVELVQHLFASDDGDAVLLSGSTPQLGLVEPLRQVFDAIAQSFCWLAEASGGRSVGA